MSVEDKDKKKWDRIYRNKVHKNKQAANVLLENLHLLPESGKALDLACGQGANALLLSEHNLDTSAWDISSEAIIQLERQAKIVNKKLSLEVRDVINNPPVANSFDVIVICHFFDRKIIPDLINAIKMNGLVFYQTFIKEKSQDIGPTNPEYLLDKNELLDLFKSLDIILYREEGRVGDNSQGFRNEAMLIAQKNQ